MCLVIRVLDGAAQDVAWDARDVAIVVRAGVPTEKVLAGVQAVLSDLGSKAPGLGLWCFCGDPVVWPVSLGQPRVRAGRPAATALPVVL